MYLAFDISTALLVSFLTSATDRLISSAENCMELALEVGYGEMQLAAAQTPASASCLALNVLVYHCNAAGTTACAYLLRLALAVARQLKPALRGCMEQGTMLLQDVAARLQLLLVSSLLARTPNQLRLCAPPHASKPKARIEAARDREL
jgi:hypothetical protein